MCRIRETEQENEEIGTGGCLSIDYFCIVHRGGASDKDTARDAEEGVVWEPEFGTLY